MGDGADKQLRQQRQEVIDRNRAQRSEVAQTGEQQRAQLAAYYAARRQQS